MAVDYGIFIREACATHGEILKFHLSAGGWDYGALIAPPCSLNLRAN
ncbi:hypothetical protein [uncultured Campylobacter sp.]|nr:hypothetical protein [uncultured Campylobacter sp.]